MPAAVITMSYFLEFCHMRWSHPRYEDGRGLDRCYEGLGSCFRWIYGKYLGGYMENVLADVCKIFWWKFGWIFGKYLDRCLEEVSMEVWKMFVLMFRICLGWYLENSLLAYYTYFILNFMFRSHKTCVSLTRGQVFQREIFQRLGSKSIHKFKTN